MTFLRLGATVLGCPDPRLLAEFYRALLGGEFETEEPGWVTLRPPGGGHGLSFQAEPHHVPPVWPGAPGRQQMQLHLDIEVGDLDEAAAHAESCGAVPAALQPQSDVRVFVDPAGHPFCLWVR